jgi:hypothetical protein
MLEMEIETEVEGEISDQKKKDVGGEMRLCYGCGVSAFKSS